MPSARIPKPWYWELRDSWVVDIARKRYPLAKGKANGKQAWEEYHRLMVRLGRARREDVGITDILDSFLDDIDRQVRQGTRARITYEGYLRFFDPLAASLGPILAPELTPHAIHAWLDHAKPEWGPTTRANCITAIKAAFRWARRRRLIEADPIADMEKPTRKRREAALTDDQVRAILDATAGTPFADLVLGLWESGCRPGELATLTADRVDLERGVWMVLNKTRTKTGKEYRPVYLTPALVELSGRLIERHPEGLIFRNVRGRQWTRNAQACAWRRARKQLGFGPEATSYAIRHRFAITGLAAGLDPSELAALMGHSDVKMLNSVYGHWDEQGERLREAANKVRPGKPPETSGEG